jgi:hypothetical protein
LDPPGVKPTTMVTLEGHTCALAANDNSDSKQASVLLAAKTPLTRERSG